MRRIVTWTLRLIEEFDALPETYPRNTYSKELIDLLFAQPYVKIENLVTHGIAERRTASKYLKQLEEIGVLASCKAWKEMIYINPPFMEL